MATIDWPTDAEFKPATFDIGVDSPMTMWAALYTGQRQSIDNDAHRLAPRMTLPPSINPAGKAKREAVLLHLKTSGDFVRLPHFVRPVPLGTLRGSPTLSADALTGARSVAITGALSGSNLLINSSFEIDSNADGRADNVSPYSAGSSSGVAYSQGGGNNSTFCQAVSASALGATLSDRVGISLASVAAPGGSTVTFSMDVKGTVNASATVYVQDGTLATAYTFVLPAVVWTRISVTHVMHSGATAASPLCWLSASPGGAAASLAMDNAMVAIGTDAVYPGPATLLGGDVIAVGNQMLPVRYDGATLNDAGAGSVPLSVPVRSELASAAAVLWNRPVGVFQCVGVVPDIQYGGGAVQAGPELAFIETGY